MKTPTVRIRMLGNQWNFEFMKEYDVDEETANQLTGLGMAELVMEADASKED